MNLRAWWYRFTVGAFLHVPCGTHIQKYRDMCREELYWQAWRDGFATAIKHTERQGS